MEVRLLLGFLMITLLLNSASAAPFSVNVQVNGVDPSKEMAVVSAGEPVQVSVEVNVDSQDVVVSGVEFTSDPSAMAGILEAFLESRVDFPKTLESTEDTNSYDLPGFIPAGEYDITAKVHYSGSQTGVYTYRGNVQVENEGILSMLLGLIVKVTPKFIMKPLAGLII
ncbi:MAG: hypothetical protein V1744_07030 [Candidatus Altiarchaeota archaeon]